MIYFEASIIPYNSGAPLAAEIISWLFQHGFNILGLPEARADFPTQQDFLFAKVGHPLFAYFSKKKGLVHVGSNN